MTKDEALKMAIELAHWCALAIYGIVFVGSFAYILKVMWIAIKFGWNLL